MCFQALNTENPFRIKIPSPPVTPHSSPCPPPHCLSLSPVMDVACASDWKGNRLFSLCVSQQSGAVNRRAYTQPCEAVMSLSSYLPRASKTKDAKRQENTQTATETKSLSKLCKLHFVHQVLNCFFFWKLQELVSSIFRLYITRRHRSREAITATSCLLHKCLFRPHIRLLQCTLTLDQNTGILPMHSYP